MISLIGKSAGIRSKLLAANTRLENAYVLVRPDSPVRTLGELRGKRAGYSKGNFIQLQTIRMLGTVGLTEQDLRSVNVNWVTGQAALLSGDIDALVGGSEALNLKGKGAARIIYGTQGQPPRLTGQAGLLVSEDFVEKYPELTKRVLKVLVQGAYWASQDGNREAAYAIWADGHRTVETLREDYGDRPLADRVSPLLDPFFVAQYKDTQKIIGGLGLLRGGAVDIDGWFDGSYLAAALRELGLQNYWVPLDADGARPARK
jgi:sulfonate transport system substrate-binding protein